jgi:hypothetical protein
MRRLTTLLVALGATLGLAVVLVVALAFNGSDDDAGGTSVRSEGIDVHGDWRIGIYNEDGTLDREYAFQNALLPDGVEAITTLLGLYPEWSDTSVIVPSAWVVLFGDLAPTPEESASPCTIDLETESGGNLPAGHNSDLTLACGLIATSDRAPGLSGVLTITSIPGGARLTGSATATRDGSIEYVETWLQVVDVQESVPMTFAFTGTDVGPFEGITTGQTIEVTVEFTFQTPAP